jgi:putative ABC transport system substrate-binding protein
MSNCLPLSGGWPIVRAASRRAQRQHAACGSLTIGMRRRDFLALLGGIGVSWPLGAHAQQRAMPVVGALSPFSPPANLDDLVRGPIHQGMGELGFVDGQNMAWEYHWAEGHYERLPALAADLVSRKVDVIVTSGGSLAALAAKNATSTIPIVFASVAVGHWSPRRGSIAARQGG